MGDIFLEDEDDWNDEEEDDSIFNYKKATLNEIFDHVVNNEWEPGVFLESTLLNNETLNEKAIQAIKKMSHSAEDIQEDPITGVEYEVEDMNSGLVNVWHVFPGKAKMFRYGISTLYKTLLNTGNRYFTHSLFLSNGFTDEDLLRITKFYAKQVDKTAGIASHQIPPLKSRAIKAKDNDEQLTQQLIARIQEEDSHHSAIENEILI